MTACASHMWWTSQLDPIGMYTMPVKDVTWSKPIFTYIRSSGVLFQPWHWICLGPHEFVKWWIETKIFSMTFGQEKSSWKEFQRTWTELHQISINNIFLGKKVVAIRGFYGIVRLNPSWLSLTFQHIPTIDWTFSHVRNVLLDIAST